MLTKLWVSHTASTCTVDTVVVKNEDGNRWMICHLTLTPSICSVTWRKSHWNILNRPSSDWNELNYVSRFRESLSLRQFVYRLTNLRCIETPRPPREESWWTGCCSRRRTRCRPARSTPPRPRSGPGCGGGLSLWICHTAAPALSWRTRYHWQGWASQAECPGCPATWRSPPAGGRMWPPSSILLPRLRFCPCSFSFSNISQMVGSK